MKRLRQHYALMAILAFAPMTSSCFLLKMLGLGLTDGGNSELMLGRDDAAANYPYRVRSSNSQMRAADDAKLYGNY